MMKVSEVRFSVASYATWMPNKSVNTMPAMLRRRASTPGKMALDAAYACLGESTLNIPILFCSRHGECERSASLLADLVRDIPLSPTSFSLSVHNATGGLFSIARHDHANSLAISAGQSTIEHAVIEACGLLADGNPAVLMVAYDHPLPDIFMPFQDCEEKPYAWAWLIEPPGDHAISLSWSASANKSYPEKAAGPDIIEFFTNKVSPLVRISNGRQWQWKHEF